jgi:hypothetical protein
MITSVYNQITTEYIRMLAIHCNLIVLRLGLFQFENKMGNLVSPSNGSPLTNEEIKQFIYATIATSPGFEEIVHTTSASSDQVMSEYDKAIRIIIMMHSRGFRPITPEEYIKEFTKLNNHQNGKPIYIWKPILVEDDISMYYFPHLIPVGVPLSPEEDKEEGGDVDSHSSSKEILIQLMRIKISVF